MIKYNDSSIFHKKFQSCQLQYKIKETSRPQIFLEISQRKSYYLKYLNLQEPYKATDFNRTRKEMGGGGGGGLRGTDHQNLSQDIPITMKFGTRNEKFE